MDIKEKINELNAMLLEGKMLDAFEKFYHDDVVMQENSSPAVVGKDANRVREVEFLNNIAEFRGAVVKSVAVGENVTMVEWDYDYTHKEWGVRKYTQIAVQKWKDGLIISETFYYGN